jgi:hypothetical protein
MAAPQPAKPSGWFTGRTRVITVASVVAVCLAGATAVSANVGILDHASESAVGNASAIGDLAPPATQVVDVYLTDPVTTTTPPTTSPATEPGESHDVQEFAVDVAGTIAVASSDSGLHLDRVVAAPGWTWNLTQSSPSQLLVKMTNGSRTLEFTASATPDGNITAAVNEIIVAPAPTAASQSSGGGSGSRSGSGDDHEQEHEQEHYDGGEQDD